MSDRSVFPFAWNQLRASGFSPIYFFDDKIVARYGNQLVVFVQDGDTVAEPSPHLLDFMNAILGRFRVNGTRLEYEITPSLSSLDLTEEVTLSFWETQHLGLEIVEQTLKSHQWTIDGRLCDPNQVPQLYVKKGAEQQQITLETFWHGMKTASGYRRALWNQIIKGAEAHGFEPRYCKVTIASGRNPFDPRGEESGSPFPIVRGEGVLPKLEFYKVHLSANGVDFEREARAG